MMLRFRWLHPKSAREEDYKAGSKLTTHDVASDRWVEAAMSILPGAAVKFRRSPARPLGSSAVSRSVSPRAAVHTRGRVIPTWCMYLPERCEYGCSHASSDSKKSTCARPSPL